MGTPSCKGSWKSKCLALSDYIVEVSKEERVWQQVDGLPINNAGYRAKGWASPKAPPHSRSPSPREEQSLLFKALFCYIPDK